MVINFVVKKISLSAACLFFFVFPTGMLFSWHLFLHKKIDVKKPVIRLVDVGNIYGKDLTVTEKNGLLDTVIATSPLIDAVWPNETIKNILSGKYIFPETVRGNQIQLRVSQKTIDKNEIAEKIREYYLKFIDPENFQINTETDISIPEYLSWDIEIMPGTSPGKKEAKIKLVDISEQNIITISYILLRKKNVFIASKKLEPGQRITRENVFKKEAFMDSSVDSFEEFPLGYEITRTVLPGAAVQTNDARGVIDVRAGDSVSFIYSQKNLLIEADAKAAEDGRIGQIIRFKSKNKYIFGELLSASRAEYRSGK